ncbi:MAG: formylglycine-generating enzyme family protein [Planctomycetes bacterium]|nr:formylglycine-generating enzyme family protein [Planctomycetota bacterium]
MSLVLLGRANREVERADQAEQFVERLTDRTELAALRKELEEELAIDSAMGERFQAWHDRGDRLLARRQAHAEFLAQLRRLALPPGPDTPAATERRREAERDLRYTQARTANYIRELAEAEAAGDAARVEQAKSTLRDARDIEERAAKRLADVGSVRFADPAVQAMHDHVRALVDELGAFAERRPNLTTQLAGRLLWRLAGRVVKESVEQHKSAWDTAIERIAAPEGRYGGLRIAPQEGLVPLGPDPRSGLEEFAQLFTGSLPSRLEGGELDYALDSAIVLVLLPGGEVKMGPGREVDIAMQPRFHGIPPVAAVRLPPFFLSKQEVTQAQWLAIEWSSPAIEQEPDGSRRRHPVEHITVFEAMTFARRLRLAVPNEAQWEYACRAGARTAFSFGDDLTEIRAHGNLFEDLPIAETPPDGFHRSAPVGSYRANGYGLFDMHGNVREWTCDSIGWYDETHAGPDGRRATSSQRSFVVRGGSFLTGGAAAQCWWRESEPPGHRFGDLGFRVARSVGER